MIIQGEREIKPGVKENFSSVSIIFFAIRILMGGMMLEEGLHKIISGTFSAEGFLSNSVGPLSGWYGSMIPYTPLLNTVVIWAQILIGIALLLGLLVRFMSFCAAIMMVIFYLAYIPSPLGWINYQLIYAGLFVVNMVSGSGYFFGFDSLFYTLENTKHSLRLLFG